MSASGATATSQVVTLPTIPELFTSDFLDVLVPRREVHEDAKDAAKVDPAPTNPMMQALKATSHYTLTTNGAMAFNSTLSDTLDAFNSLRPGVTGKDIFRALDKAWAEDPLVALRLIWNLRSIHDGKGERELFYQAWGWLYKNHPRTALENLPLLVEPVCQIGKSQTAPHGYWKDLLNILCLAFLDQLGPLDETPSFLSYPKLPSKRRSFSRRRGYKAYPPKKQRKGPLPDEDRVKKLAEVRAVHVEAKEEARKLRVQKSSKTRQDLDQKLRDPKFRALYILVARLFAEKLAADVRTAEQLEATTDQEERYRLSRNISLVGKWAPTPGCAHDRHTNIATAIAAILHHSHAIGTQRVVVVPGQGVATEEAHILRSFYQRWVLTPLRKVTHLPEPLMSSGRWKEIKYNRVASKCMKSNMERFYTHDPEGFEKYLEGVEKGTKKISGATLMPHEILSELLLSTSGGATPKNMPEEAKQRISEVKSRGTEAQWKAMLDRLREAGKLENALAVCDVSGSMGSLDYIKPKEKYVQPILPAVALSLVLAHLAKPPFSNGFITFSENPQFIQLDPTLSLLRQVQDMNTSGWGMNTNLESVFLKLLLPLAVKNQIKQEDMIQRLFIFSDMQFDESINPNNSWYGSTNTSTPVDWSTNHDVIEKAYKEAGYEMPEIVYWNLALQEGTLPVTHEKKGVAIMSGFSAAMVKVFLGEEEEEVVEEGWEDVKPDVVEKKEREVLDPIGLMKKALSKKSFLGLVVVD